VRGVEEGAGGRNNDPVLSKLLDGRLNSLDSTLQVGLPDVTAVNDTGREDSLGAKGANDSLKLLGVADKVNMDGIDVLGNSLKVVDDVSEVGGEDELGDLVTKAGKLLVRGLEGSLALGRKVEDEDRLVDLDSLGTSLLQLGKELDIDGEEVLEKVDRIDGLATVGLGQCEERDGADEDRACGDASLLGLGELGNSLGAPSELEGLVGLESGLDVVVVGVKPLYHLQSGDIDTLLLVATAHSEVLVNAVESGVGITLRNGLMEGTMSASALSRHNKSEATYTKVLDV